MPISPDCQCFDLFRSKERRIRKFHTEVVITKSFPVKRKDILFSAAVNFGFTMATYVNFASLSVL